MSAAACALLYLMHMIQSSFRSNVHLSTFHLACLIALGILSGCGNLGKSSKLRNQQSAQSTDYSLLGTEAYSATGQLSTDENRYGKYNCPFDPNVTPSYNFEVNGSREYKVCAASDATQSFKILIHGRPSYGDAVCVFPVQESSATDIRARVDQTTQKAVTRCFSTQKLHRTPDEGVELSFDGVIFNAAMIVDGVDVAAMEFCLRNGILQNPACPRYSYGKFR